MHILLTDVLACPRCGPPFGLLLVPDDVHMRRVRAGILACANCRERFTIAAGIADLRTGMTQPPVSASHENPDAFRLAALMGVTEGPALVLVVGPGAAEAPRIAAVVQDVEVIAAGGPDDVATGAGVSALLVDERLPVMSGKLRAVALTGPAADHWLEEGARAVAPAGRLVLEPAPDNAESRLGARGLRVLAREGATVVAVRVM